MRQLRPSRASIALLAFVAAVVFGALSIWLATRPPALALPAASPAAMVLSALAGWALIVVAIVGWLRIPPDPGAPIAPIALLAGMTLFLAGWSNPGSGSAVAFTIGLLLGSLTPAAVGHLLLAYPDARFGSGVRRLIGSAGYATGLLGIGLIPALLFVPAAAGCGQCPANLLAVVSAPALASWITSLSLVMAALLAGTAALVALSGRWPATQAARVARIMVIVPGAIYLGAFAVRAAHGAPSGVLGLDRLDTTAWTIESSALVALSLGLASRWLHSRRVRGRLARLVVELAGAPRPGGLRAALSTALNDEQLRLAYPLHDGRLVDGSGALITLAARDGRRVNPLVRDGEVLALLDHRADLADNPYEVEELVRTAGLVLDNERLTAQAWARLEEVRGSQRDIVGARYAERRRLERDLHDGTQQRLVGLAILLRLLRDRLGADEQDAARIDAAAEEITGSIASVREIGHGMYSSLLADEGLARAVEALAEEGRVAYAVDSIPEGRFEPDVELAAYEVIAATPLIARASQARVNARRVPGALVVELAHDGDPEAGLVDIGDWVGALGGTVHHSVSDGLTTIRGEIPCAS
jgi:signal transduction histidine kinase